MTKSSACFDHNSLCIRAVGKLHRLFERLEFVTQLFSDSGFCDSHE